MSLINDMLRDLEARRATEQRLPVGMMQGMGGRAPTSGVRRSLIMVLATLLLVLSATIAWLVWQRYSTPQQPVAATAAAVPAAPPVMAAAVVNEPVAEVAGMAPPSPAVAPPPEPASIETGTPPPKITLKPEPRSMARSEPAPGPITMEKTVRPPSPRQQAEHAYQQGIHALRSGNHAAAESAFRTTLRLDSEHLLARETLAAMLLGAGRLIEADEVLEQGRRLFARNPTLALLLARLRVEQGQAGAAVTVLEQSLHAATTRPDYLAFLGALYQRELRYDDSIESYGRALALQPQQAGWWAGMAISLEQAGRREDAIKAYQQAAAGALPPQLQEHVRTRLKALE